MFLAKRAFLVLWALVVGSWAANATMYTLCRNSDLYELLATIVNYEMRFNRNHHYDWVFLNDEPFSAEFEATVAQYVSGRARFGVIDPENWSVPPEVDMHLMRERINQVLTDPDGAYPYADSISYRNMCRFESGFFQWHPLLLEYDYFWRVEPGVSLECDVPYDIFEYMIQMELDYGFTISTIEYPKTIPSLFAALKDVLVEQNSLHLLSSETNHAPFVLDSRNGDYNLCHFWTNFEVGNLRMFRSKQYNDIFRGLDAHPARGFFYERWGDAPIRTLILSLILDRGRIHHFHDLGYTHAPYTQCPQDPSLRLANRCVCDPASDITNKWYSCGDWFNNLGRPLP